MVTGPVLAIQALWDSALGSLLCGVCLGRDAGLGVQQLQSVAGGTAGDICCLVSIPLQSAGRVMCSSSSGMLCPWHTLDSLHFLLQESCGVAERTRTEEGREEALEM